MPFVPVPNTALIRMEGTVDGQLTINTVYFEVSGGGITGVNLAALVTAVGGWAQSTIAPILSDDWALVRTIGTDLTAANSFQYELATPATGGVSGEANPNNVAACVKFVTALSGRSFRGSNFIPAVPGSVVTLNTMDQAFMDDVTGAYFQLIGAGIFLAGWQWVVASRFSGVDVDGHPIPRTTGIVTPVIGTSFVNPYVKSMRSREVGHGA
jgi:hypothetical protein